MDFDIYMEDLLSVGDCEGMEFLWIDMNLIESVYDDDFFYLLWLWNGVVKYVKLVCV